MVEQHQPDFRVRRQDEFRRHKAPVLHVDRNHALFLLILLSLLLAGHGTLGLIFGVLLAPFGFAGLWRGGPARLGGGVMLLLGLFLLFLALRLVMG